MPAAKSVPVKVERLQSKPAIESHPVDAVATPLIDLKAEVAAGLQVGGDLALHQMKRKPIATVVLGFLTGVLVGGLLAGRSHRGHKGREVARADARLRVK